GNPVALSGGQASSPVMFLPVGDHTVTAQYSGDNDLLSSTSQVAPQPVGLASTAATVSSNNSESVFGQPLTFSVTVAAVAPGAGGPTGSVQFILDGAYLGTLQTLGDAG